MRTALLLMCAVILVSACGVRRPLMRPSEVPAYEAKRAQERAERDRDRTPPQIPQPAP